MSDDTNFSKPRMICEPWDGTQGAAFTRQFAPNFKGALHGMQDRYATLYEHLNEEDPGSTNNPHPGAIGSDARIESERLYHLRSRKLFSLIRQHVIDETVRQDIDDNAGTEGVAAWRIVTRYGQLPRTGLTEIDEDAAWTGLRLSDVGIDERTIVNIMAHMHRLNRERDAARQYNNESLRKKLLSLITYPQNLAAKAQEELQRPSYKQNNTPSLQLTVNAFDELWRHAFRNGQIKRQAPPQRSRGGNRVDAMHADTDKLDAYRDDDRTDDYYADDGAPGEEETEAFGAFSKFQGVPTSLKGQKLCDNCFGWGHNADACPSDKQPRRPGDCIDGVRYLKLTKRRPLDRRDQIWKPKEGATDRLRTKRGRFHKRFKFNDRNAKRTYTVETDDEGNLYALDDGIDVQPAPGDCEESNAVDSHALVHCDQDYEHSHDAFGVIPPVLDTNMAWALSGDAGTIDATTDPLVASYLKEKHSNEHPEATTKDRPSSRATSTLGALASLPKRMTNAVATRAIRQAKRTVTALLLLMLALIDGAPTAAPTAFTTYALNNAGSAATALIDSGSTRTASGDRRLFPTRKIKHLRPNMRVRVANGVYLPVEFIGTLVLTLPPGEVKARDGTLSTRPTVLELPDALYVPGLCATLLSTKAMFREQNIRTYLNDELRLVLPDARHVRIRETQSNYTLHAYGCHHADVAAHAAEAARGGRAGGQTATDLTHARLAHFSIERINATVGHARGLEAQLPASERTRCRACTIGGATKPSTKNPTERIYEHYGDCIASDLCEMPSSSPFGFKYMLTFYDLATKYLEVYYLRTATAKEVKASFEQFLTDNKRYTGGRAITWLTDNGAEFFEKDLDKFLREFEIRHRATVPYNPQTNPAERANKLLLRPCRIMLAAANAGDWLWPWAVNQIVYVHNALCTRSRTAIAPLTPHELKTGTKPRVDKLRVMFCEAVCYLRGEQQEESKLAPRRTAGIHLGIDHRRGGYFIYLPSINRLTTVRFDDVEFFEDSFPEMQRITGTYVSYTTRYALPSVEQQIGNSQANPPRLFPPRESSGPTNGEEIDASGEGQTAGQPQGGAPLGDDDGPPSRRLRPRARAAGHACIADEEPEGHIALATLDDADMTLYLSKAALVSDVLPEPRSYAELSGRPDEHEWRQAVLDEYRGKVENGTFDLVRRPAGQRVCKTKLVFRNKIENGTLKGRKVRWVLCGYSQRPGVDYNRTFTATARATSVRIFFAFVAHFDLNLKSVDVTRAFTHAELTDAELYCEQMEGTEQYDETTGERLVCKLKKALEGGKQCGHLWQVKLTTFLKKYGFDQFFAEPCIFSLKTPRGFLLLLVWIDDIAIAYNNEGMAEEFVTNFSGEFKSTASNNVTRFIGIAITRDREARTISLSQREYIEKMTSRFLPTETLRKAINTPAWFLDKASRVSTYSALGTATSEQDSAAAKGKPYLELVASILYAETMTRPDIAYHVGMLCRFMHNPSTQCYARAEELLNYLYATRAQCIVLGGASIAMPTFTVIRDAGAKELDESELSRRLTGNFGLMTFSDSSWKVDHTYVAHVSFVMNGPVDWSTRLLKVSASSCHAETAAACMAARRNRYIRALLSYLLKMVDAELTGGATLLFMDNSAAVDQAENLSASKKTEHYRRWEYTLREAQNDGEIKSIFVRTTEQLADILTKVVDKGTYLKHVKNILKGRA